MFAFLQCSLFNSSIVFIAVSQLREHWEETSAKVMARRNQLEDLLVDNQQFDSKRREVEAWLSRMEAWLARMRPVGMTADVLETQIREQKVKRQLMTSYNYYAEMKEHHLLAAELLSQETKDPRVPGRILTRVLFGFPERIHWESA